MTEPLSISKNLKETPKEFPKEVPKHKNALEEKYQAQPKKEITKESTRLPQPTGWRILVLPFKIDEKTKQVASQCGNVLAMGGSCYSDKDRYPEGPWCKVGDWVVFARYAGSRIEIEGGEVRLLNEDEVLATVKDPNGYFA